MAQQGQVFAMKSNGPKTGPFGGTGIGRVGAAREGCSAAGLSRSATQRSRLSGRWSECGGRTVRGSTLALAALVDEYLAQHDAQPETIEKLRWLRLSGSSPTSDGEPYGSRGS